MKTKEILDINSKLENQSRTVKMQQAMVDKLKQDLEDEKHTNQEIEHQYEHLKGQGIQEEKKFLRESLEKQLK